MQRHNDEIWLALDSRGIGGIETHVLQVALGLREARREVRVVLLAGYGDHPLLHRLHREAIPVTVLDGGLGALYRALRDGRPRLLHTHGYQAGILGRLAGRWLGIPVVSTFHAGEPGRGRVRLYSLLDRLTAPLATALAVSAEIARRIPGRVAVVDNFVTLPAAVAAGDKRRVAFVGRLSEEKGPDLFLAMTECLPGGCFRVYGDGPLRPALERGAPHNVLFMGQAEAMEEVWREVGLLCVTSRHEGLPMAALEAMAHGVPVAAFAVGGLPGLIRDGVDGFLVAPGNLDGMRAAVTRWQAMEPAERAAFGRRARLRIEQRHSPAAAMPALLGFYARAAGAPL